MRRRARCDHPPTAGSSGDPLKTASSSAPGSDQTPGLPRPDRWPSDEGLPQESASFTTAHVYQFLGYVANTGVSPVTHWRRQRETCAFFSSLLRHDYTPAKPFAKVKNI